MRRLIVLTALVATGALGIGLAAFQAPAQPKVLEVEKLKDNLFLLKGGGGNTAAFVTATGVVVVDSKLPGWGQVLLDTIKTVTDKPVTMVINTHTHYDHVSGQVEFPATVEVVAHANTKALMEQANPVYGLQTGPQPNIFKDHGGRGYPTRTFTDTLTLGQGADRIDLYYFGRAHTGGDAYVVFPALHVMHAGDTFPGKDLPIMDINNGGSGVDFAGTLTKAAALPGIELVINGHNPKTTTIPELKEYAAFIGDFVAAAQAAKRAGKTVEEFVPTWTTPAKYAGYATPNPARVKADAEVVYRETK
ncbi:MAG: MBL fold metallo-hydrolase [Vicinamibacterales bacterium]